MNAQTGSPLNTYTVPSVSIKTAHTGATNKANALGMRTMQERAYAKRGEQYLLIKSPPASGKSRALMFVALDKLNNQGIKQAIIVVPERSIGSSFADEPLTKFGFYWDWQVAPQWNLCNAPGADEPKVAKSKVESVKKFLASGDKVLVCTHATFRFAVEELGIQSFDDRLIAIDEFHHVSSTATDMGPLFSDSQEQDDIETGTIYVLRSQSSHPYVAEHRELIHKIGVTGGKVETRISGADKEATYLLAGVEVVAAYKLHNINRVRMENLFHKIFSSAQIDITIDDRFGNPVKPREWFLVPLHVIDQAVKHITDGTITELVYDTKSASLKPA